MTSLVTPALLATASCYGACKFVVAISFLALLLRLRSIRRFPTVTRKNMPDLYIFRLRNHSDMEVWLEEMSAIYDKNVLMQLYRIATDKPHGFLYIKVNAKDKKDMFYDSLQTKLVPEEAPIEYIKFSSLSFQGHYHVQTIWQPTKHHQGVSPRGFDIKTPKTQPISMTSLTTHRYGCISFSSPPTNS